MRNSKESVTVVSPIDPSRIASDWMCSTSVIHSELVESFVTREKIKEFKTAKVMAHLLMEEILCLTFSNSMKHELQRSSLAWIEKVVIEVHH